MDRSAAKKVEAMFFKALQGTILFLMFASVVFAAPKSLSDYWRDTDLTWAKVSAELSTAHCGSDPARYQGCIEAARAVMARLGLGVDIADTIGLDGTSTIGGFELVRATSRKPISADSSAEKLELIRAKQKLTRDYWRVRFHLDEGHQSFETLWQWLGKQLPKDLEIELAAAAYNAYLSHSKDPASRLTPTAFLNDETLKKEDEYVGVGVTLASMGNEIVVRRLIPHGPADKAGLQVLDSILTINGVSVVGLSGEGISERMKVGVGTKLRLTIHRNRGTKKIEVTPVKLVQKRVETKWLGEKGPTAYGYIRLVDFSGLANCEEAEKAVTEFEREKAKGIIIDVRGNPGGRLNDALCVANLFFPERQHIYSILPLPGYAGFSHYGATAVGATTALPVVTLVDSQSASAAELLAGALQDWARALVLGDRTFGKGTVQFPHAWNESPSVSYVETAGLFYLPSGRSTQLAGVSPDLRPVFASANPSPAEKLALRQEDLSMNPIVPPSSPKRTPRDFSAVQECVDKEGRALAKWKTRSNDVNHKDFALLTAQDALNCWHDHTDLRWEIVSGPDL